MSGRAPGRSKGRLRFFRHLLVLGFAWLVTSGVLLPVRDSSGLAGLNSLGFSIAGWLITAFATALILSLFAYRSEPAWEGRGITTSRVLAVTSVAAIGASLISLSSSSSAPWKSVPAAVKPDLVTLSTVLVLGCITIVKTWDVLSRQQSSAGRAALTIPLAFTAVSSVFASSFFGVAVSAEVPSVFEQRDRVIIYSGKGLESLNVWLSLTDTKTLENDDGMRVVTGADVVSPVGQTTLSFQGRGAPGATVEFAVEITGNLAKVDPKVVRGTLGDYTATSVYRAGATSGSVVNGVCQAERLDSQSTFSREKDRRLIRWKSEIDAKGQLVPTTFQLGDKLSWFTEAGSKNLVELPGVTIKHTYPASCTVGEDDLSGSWFAASRDSTTNVDVIGSIPTDAVIDKRPEFDLGEPSLRWLMSSGPSSVNGVPGLPINGNPASLDATYLISSSTTENRSSRSIFFAGILSGGAIAGAFEFLRALFGTEAISAAGKGTLTSAPPPRSDAQPSRWMTVGWSKARRTLRRIALLLRMLRRRRS